MKEDRSLRTKKPQQDAAKVEAKKTAQQDEPKIEAKKPKEKSAAKEFMPVIFDNKPDKFPVSAINDVKIAIPVEIEGSEYVAITLKDSTYYVRPSTFQKYVLNKSLTPKDADNVRKEVKECVQEVKRAWIKLGTAVLSVHTPRLYLDWGHKSFEDYCENELKLHQSTIYQIMTSTLFLMRDQPDVYQKLMEGEKKIWETLPSYHAIYLLEKKRKRLQDKGRYEELHEQIFQQGMSTRELAKELHKILGVSTAQPSLPTLVKSYARLCKQMQKLKVDKEVLEKALEVLERLKKAKE
jgi:hypothetical protein